jgi:hypothetical protein
LVSGPEEVEIRLMRGIFGPKRREETGGWRKLRNRKLHNFHSHHITEDEMGAAC